MKSSEILRKVLKRGLYKAWTGIEHNPGDEYMCITLKYLTPTPPIEDLKRTRRHIRDALGDHHDTLLGCLRSYRLIENVTKPTVRDPKARQLALGFFQDLAEYLESIGD